MRDSFHIAELYRLVRGRKSAAKLLVHLVAASLLIGVWALATPINQTVSFRTRLVPKGEFGGRDGAFQPSCASGGIVASVSVQEFQTVAKGETLLEFDSSELRVRRKGEAGKIENLEREIAAKEVQRKLAMSSFHAKETELLAQLDVELKRVKRSGSEREIQIGRAKAELARAAKELDRGKRLDLHLAISKSEYENLRSENQKAKKDLALAELPVEQSRVSEIKAQRDSLESSHRELLHKLDTETLVLRSKISVLRNEVELLDLKISQCKVIASRGGVVSECHVKAGDWVESGPIALTVSREGFMAEAFLPSRLIGEVRKGNSAVIVLDGIDWLVYGSIDAQVMKISADVQEEETVLGDGSSEVIDGYRVWLDLKPESGFKRWDSVRLGMTGTVEIKTGKEKLALHLLKRAFGESWIPRN